ncbi:MAG: DNA-directed RNA polymerase subunit alpha, partial [Candidatus Omnitrophica bacterium]|nr:DNA-directed RNA polymerase subunit alpha [Candidatus Omnitrophota bacterium]
MGIKWRDFQLPKRLECDESTYTSTYGRFSAAPFERGYGVTLGNSLRRVLLSSIEGSAVTSVKIQGVQHEFSTIAGVVEDVPEIILNLKSLLLNSHSKIPKTIYLKRTTKGEVKAKDIEVDETIEIINPDLHIATLTKDVKLNIEMEVARGR